MRKAVLTLVAIALIGCVVGAADGLSGTWRSRLLFDPTPATTFIINFGSILDIDYVAGPVTFGFAPMFFGPVPLDGDLFLDAYGRFGAFAFASFGWLDFVTAKFMSWVNGWWLDMAGIELFGMFFMDEIQPFTGFGWTFGGYGYSGNLSLGAEVKLNAQDGLSVFDGTGFWFRPYVWTRWLADGLYPEFASAFEKPMGTWNPFVYQICDTFTGNIFTPGVQSGCCSCLTDIDIYLTYSFCCLDVGMRVDFSCEGGFDGVRFWARDIEIPAWPWLKIQEVGLIFDEGQNGKFMTGLFALDLGEFACITPFFEINRGLLAGNWFNSNAPFVFDNVGVVALHMECTLGDVTFRAGSEFGDDARYFDRRGIPVATLGAQNFYPSTTPPLYMNCEWPPPGYDEFFGIITGGDGCCGGETAFSVFFWTDDGNSDLLFDLEEIDIDLSFGITQNAIVKTGVRFTETNLVEELLLGVEISF